MAITEVVNLLVRVNQAGVRNVQEFGRMIGASSESLRHMDRANVSAINSGARFGFLIRRLTTGFRGFKFEMLSVLFFGMAIQRFFLGMLQPAFQLAGIFDILRTTLEVFFLPAALALLEKFFIPMMDFLLTVPEPMQKVIGFIFLFAGALGALLTFTGVVTLGLGGLIQAFSFIGPLIAAIATVGFGVLLLILAAVALAVVNLWDAWRTNFGNIKGWTMQIVEGVTNIFGGLINIIMGWIDIFRGFFTGDFNLILQGIGRIKDGVISALKGLAQLIIGWFAAGSALAINVLKKAYQLGRNIVEALVDGVKSLGGKVKDVFTEVIPDSAKNLFGKVGGVVSKGRSLIGLQEGGIVTRPTPAIIGEAGPEAVVPLNKLGGFGNSVTNNITVNASLNSIIDPSELARIIGQEVATQTERALRR